MAEMIWITFLVLYCGFYIQRSEAQSTESKQATESEDVTLSCTLTGSFTLPAWRGPPGLTIYTSQDVEAINPSIQVASRLQYASNKKDLILSNAEISDSGDYKCSYAAKGDHTVTLTVSAKSTTTPPTSTTTPPSSSTTTPPPALSTAPPSTTTKSPDKKITVIIIVASVVGGVAIVFLSIIACIKLRKKTNRKKKYGAGPKTKDSKEMSSF